MTIPHCGTTLSVHDVLAKLEAQDRFFGYITNLTWLLSESRELPIGESFWSEIHHQAAERAMEFRRLRTAIHDCTDTVVLQIAARLADPEAPLTPNHPPRPTSAQVLQLTVPTNGGDR